MEDAITIFELNGEEYPEAANPWDSLGEGYMMAGREEEAIEAYRKSQELDPGNENAARKLEQWARSRPPSPRSVLRTAGATLEGTERGREEPGSFEPLRSGPTQTPIEGEGIDPTPLGLIKTTPIRHSARSMIVWLRKGSPFRSILLPFTGGVMQQLRYLKGGRWAGLSLLAGLTAPIIPRVVIPLVSPGSYSDTLARILNCCPEVFVWTEIPFIFLALPPLVAGWGGMTFSGPLRAGFFGALISIYAAAFVFNIPIRVGEGANIGFIFYPLVGLLIMPFGFLAGILIGIFLFGASG